MKDEITGIIHPIGSGIECITTCGQFIVEFFDEDEYTVEEMIDEVNWDYGVECISYLIIEPDERFMYL
jgi:hypothetical protein